MEPQMSMNDGASLPFSRGRLEDGKVEHRDAAAFTMVELLTVMAIIAVLAALVFPAIQNSLAKSKDTACIANLRTLGQGMGLMLQDHDGMFPRSQETTPVWGGETGMMLACGVMAEYLQLARGSDAARKLACPAAKYPGYIPGTNPRLYTTSALGYGVNPAICPWITPAPVERVVVTSIQRPSQVIVLGDAGQQANGNAPFFINWSGKFDYMRGSGKGDPAGAEDVVAPSFFKLGWMPEPLLPVDRHHGKAHFLFADGHVGAIEMDEIREKNLFWNY